MALTRACSISPRLPLIVILGATGTGKTKLSIELAQKYKTEVISADSMQVYKSLDVVTAKATPEERSLVPHHLLDILQPHQTYTVLDYRNAALKIIDNLKSREKLPIIVGGTNYYIEAVLWKILVEDLSASEAEKLVSERNEKFHKAKRLKTEVNYGEGNQVQGELARAVEVEDACEVVLGAGGVNEDLKSAGESEDDYSDATKLSNEYLHQKLKEIDPDAAERLHPNNRRRILRSLQVWVNTGRTHSAVLEEQRAEAGGCGIGGPLRYPEALIFWLTCQKDIHDKRLTDRVDAMIRDGLVKELTDFHETYNKHRITDGEPTNYTTGIFQSIGFKEFHKYLILNEEERLTQQGYKLFEESLENMKIATKRYARYQNKMFKNRFLGHPGRQVPPVYKLDTSDVSQWQANVTDKAIGVIESFIHENECPLESEPLVTSMSYIDGNNPNVTHYCEICERVFIGDHQYKIHMVSRKHKKVTSKKLRMIAKSADEKGNPGEDSNRCSSL